MRANKEAKKGDIYKHRRRTYKKEEERLEKARLEPENKQLIKDFHTGLFAGDCGEQRVAKVSSQLRWIASYLEEETRKTLSQVETPELEALLAGIKKRREWSPNTKADYRRAIKQFYRWFRKRDTRLLPPEDINIEATKEEQVAQQSRRREKKEENRRAREFYEYVSTDLEIGYQREEIQFSEIITEDDLRLVLEKGCRSVKEKAFLCTLHEGGFRAGEILNMRIRDLKRDGSNAFIASVNGKTGPREVTLIMSVSHIHNWLALHPQRENKDAWLWVSECPRRKHLQLEHAGASKMVRKCFERAGLKDKRHNLHWFRHSRASLLYPHMSEAVLCQYFGWEIGSEQVRTYIKTNPEHTKEAIKKLRGLEEEKRDIMERRCFFCQCVNPPGTDFCGRCGKGLTTLAAKELENANKDAFQQLVEVLSNPERAEKFKAFFADLSKEKLREGA